MLAFCIMDVVTAAKYLAQGYRIRRTAWTMATYITEVHGHLWGRNNQVGSFSMSLDLSDLLADDWEIITTGIVKDFPITYSD